MSISGIPSGQLSGRSLLKTDITDPTVANIKTDLETRILAEHNYNAAQIQWLQDYHKGWHPAIQARVKQTRVEIDNKVTVNYAGSITRDIVGYFLGKPIQYTNRNGKFRKQMENFTNAINAENKQLVDYEIAEDCSICGVGYRGVFSEQNPRNGTTLKLLRLDARDTFVVYSSNPAKPPVYAVTSYETQADILGGSIKRVYTVYTTNQMMIFEQDGSSILGVPALGILTLKSTKDILFGGNLPIIEYQNNLWRLGDWETAITIMNALDATASDGVNDIQQAVNSVLVALGIDLTDEVFAKLSQHGFLSISNIPPGSKPDIKFISEAMSADVGVSLRDYLEATLRVIVGVPDRKTRGGGGGDTGDAVFMRDGWQDIDLVASGKEPYFIQAEREALAVMLYVLDTNSEVANINAVDIDIHFNRNKTANLQSKSQVFQTLIAAGMAPVDALDIASLTNNIHDVIMRMDAIKATNAQKALDDAALAAKNAADLQVKGAAQVS